MGIGEFREIRITIGKRLIRLALVGALALSGCYASPNPSQVSENTSIEDFNVTDAMDGGANVDGATNGGAPASAMTSWCDIANDSLPKAECDRLQSFVSHLKIGEAGLRSPDEMYIGDTRQITFAITTDPSASAAKEALGNPVDSKRTSTTVTSPVKVARRMSANLTGAGFDITPVGEQMRDLAGTGQAFWTWQITAKDANAVALDLSVSAVMLDDKGQPSPHVVRVMHRDIRVKVHHTVAWLVEQINQLSTLTKALVALVGGLGALWLAVKTFGKGKGDRGDAAKKPGGGPSTPPAP